jgi:hypothetical protein
MLGSDSCAPVFWIAMQMGSCNDQNFIVQYCINEAKREVVSAASAMPATHRSPCAGVGLYSGERGFDFACESPCQVWRERLVVGMRFYEFSGGDA